MSFPSLTFMGSQFAMTAILLGLESPVSSHPGVHTLHSLWAASPSGFLSTCFSGSYGNGSHWVRFWSRGPLCAPEDVHHTPSPSLPL